MKNIQAIIRFIPEWAKGHGGGGVDANAGHDDMGGHSNMEADPNNAGHEDMGGNSSSTHTTEVIDMGPGMNEAVAVANGKSLLRGRRLQDGHDAAGNDMSHTSVETSTHDEIIEAHDATSHQDDHMEADHDKNAEHMVKPKPYDDGGCIGISEVSKDMLPPSWGGTNEGATHVHPSRPINEGIYTMDGVK
jgi:hypothetical protein